MKLATLSGSECTDFVQSNSAPNNMNLLRPCEKPMLILQGDRDTTVDWRYNVRLLRDKFPAANVEMIPGARHELLNEAAEYRSKVIGRIVKELKIDNW